MAVVWAVGPVKVEEVRAQQPKRRRSAHTTLLTVMNRLVDRGLLVRRRDGNAYVYEATYDEGTYLARALGQRLAEASPDVRKAALVNLVDRLEPAERDEVARYARRISRARADER